MKKFIAPTIELIKIDSADIIATSLDITDGTTNSYQSRGITDNWGDDNFDF